MQYLFINIIVLTSLFGLCISNLEAKTLALVIGIDQYHSSETSLDGAVNDARDIVTALRSAGVKHTRLLLNHAASKKAIKMHWDRMLRESKPNDVLLVTYAGHGSQIPDRNGDERDKMDEVFILSSYQKRSRYARQSMISDDEWGNWFSKATGRTVLFVVDSCHSGTADKGSLANKFKQRSIKASAPPVSAEDKRGRDNNPNVLIISATTANRSIYEVSIDAKKRGALSWAFATAIRGKADLNKNKWLEKAELERFMRTEVQRINHGQTPLFLPRHQFNYQKIIASARLLSPSSYKLSLVLSRINNNDFNIALYGNQYPYLTFYNITEKGIIQLLYPIKKQEEKRKIRSNFNLKLKLDKNTLGNDQLVVIFSSQPQERLHLWLNDYDQKKAYHALRVQRPALLRGSFEEHRLKYRSH